MKILAVEDGGFVPWRKGKTLLVGAVLHSRSIIEDVLLSKIEIDGLDATDKLIEMVKRYGRSLDLIMLASIPYAGFNVMDPKRLYDELRIPVVVVNPEKPDSRAVKVALQTHFRDWRKRLSIINKVGKPSRLKIDEEKVLYIHSIGMPKRDAARIIKDWMIVGYRPEPLRVARLLAHGLTVRQAIR